MKGASSISVGSVPEVMSRVKYRKKVRENLRIGKNKGGGGRLSHASNSRQKPGLSGIQALKKTQGQEVREELEQNEESIFGSKSKLEAPKVNFHPS